MRQSQLFTRTRKEAPKDEISKNSSLLIRAGFIDKLSAGIYSYLPLGLKVIRKIENIIREEMNAVGGQEILMPSLHPKENWEKTGRWDSLDVLFKTEDAGGKEYALGPTHEEVVVPLAQSFTVSYRDLPYSVYQFQTKFRKELRAKSGILRGREFLMKDMYSFHATEDDMHNFYETMKGVYKKIFERVGLGGNTFLTMASGGSFSKYSYEFQTVTDSGEDIIYLCDGCRLAINQEIIDEQSGKCSQCGNGDLRKLKSIEVGNIFELKTKYSSAFQMKYKDEQGLMKDVLMGCFGIGVGRVMGAIVESMAGQDQSGMIWPVSVAPFRIHLISLAKENETKEEADRLYQSISSSGVEVLYDDRDVSSGVKFADSDLIGLPMRVIVSDKTLAEGKYEVKDRKSGVVTLNTYAELLELC